MNFISVKDLIIKNAQFYNYVKTIAICYYDLLLQKI